MKNRRIVWLDIYLYHDFTLKVFTHRWQFVAAVDVTINPIIFYNQGSDSVTLALLDISNKLRKDISPLKKYKINKYIYTYNNNIIFFSSLPYKGLNSSADCYYELPSSRREKWDRDTSQFRRSSCFSVVILNAKSAVAFITFLTKIYGFLSHNLN